MTTSANAIFLQSTAPLYLLLLGPFLLHEPVRKVDLAVIVTVGAGAALLLLGAQAAVSTSPDPTRGNLLAAAAGVTWALTITGLRWMGRNSSRQVQPAAATVIAGNLIAFALCVPLVLHTALHMAPQVKHLSATDLGVLLYLGIFQVSLAYVLLTRSLEDVPGLEAATLLLVEPVFNPIWTWVIHGEKPTASALLGGLLIVSAAFGGTLWRLKFSHSLLLPDAVPPD